MKTKCEKCKKMIDRGVAHKCVDDEDVRHSLILDSSPDELASALSNLLDEFSGVGSNFDSGSSFDGGHGGESGGGGASGEY